MTNDSLPRLGYVRCLLTPSIALAFLLVQPESVFALLAFGVAPFALDASESVSPHETRQPDGAANASWVDLLPYVLFAVHWVNLWLAADLVTTVGLATPVSLVGAMLVALSSSLAGAVTGHELIHRRAPHDRLLGRLLLCSVGYEYFFTEHIRGHHSRVGMEDDPTTARFGESFVAFVRRTIPAQIASAWRLDCAAVLQGVAIELALGAACALHFGGAALALIVVNGAVVTVLFQAVSYIEHWGLTREPGASAPVSWDTTNQSTLFSMVGPARHSDHHAHPARAFHQLRYVQDSPKLPHGYAGMISMALFRNRRFRRVMADELRARRGQ